MKYDFLNLHSVVRYKRLKATVGAFRSNFLITLNKIIAAETSGGHGG